MTDPAHTNMTEEVTMQRTTPELRITVGEAKYPITLTDSAVEAVQGEAAGRASEHFEAITKFWEGPRVDAVDEMSLEELLGLRDTVQALSEALDVLIECRPLDELDTDDE